MGSIPARDVEIAEMIREVPRNHFRFFHFRHNFKTTVSWNDLNLYDSTKKEKIEAVDEVENKYPLIIKTLIERERRLSVYSNTKAKQL